MEHVSPEELAAEQAATQTVKEDEVRAKIIEEFGFDETNDAERIDKLVAKEVESSKRLSAAIGQKIKHRTDAEELRKKVPVAPLEKKPEVKEVKTGELDDTEALILEVKGIVESDEVSLYEKWKSDTSRKPREILGNEIFKKELATLREKRQTQDATPGSPRRAGGQLSNDVDYWVAKAEQSGELPKDYDLKQKVIAKLTRKGDTSIPPWRR